MAAPTPAVYGARRWEYGVLVLSGSLKIGDTVFHADELAFIEPQSATHFTVEASENTHIMLLGGESLPHPTLIWWNFVADSREALCRALTDWNNMSPRFGDIDLSGTPLKRLVAPEVPEKLR